MEKFEKKIDSGGDVTKETRAELNQLQEKLVKESGPEIEAIKNAIESLKSFKDLPIKINYPSASREKIDQKKFPQKLDMRPKPHGNKWKNIKGEIVDNPDPLIICLDNRKFSVTPDIGIISNIVISNGKIILDVSKFGVIIKTQEYNPERMTKLLIILWTHQSGIGKDIEGTPRAIAKEIK